ncbi:hypothetical protein FO519_007723 [Halicephalobus sp. NKZ332]|nr:hypothetical protein FO519_007723 [Halicephalobus sp. NKZ332]
MQLEDGELPDSPDINITHTTGSIVELMEYEDIQIIGDSDFVLDDAGAGTLGEDDDYLIKSMDTPVSVNFFSGKSSNSRGPGCFNCGGSHNLSDCPEEKNHARIQKNRRSYLENNKMKETRICQGQLTKFKPGRLSRDARLALGLGDDEYPPWIYKMREDGPFGGYPPGWLERLMPKTDTLEFFTDDPALCGEKKVEENSFKIDIEQVVFYEGFNDIDPDADAERVLNKKFPKYAKDQYTEKLGNYVLRRYKERVSEEKNEKRRKRHFDDEEEYLTPKKVDGTKKNSKKIKTATKKALDSFYNGWITGVEILKKHEDGEIRLDDKELRKIKETIEEDIRITEELQKIDEQKEFYGLTAKTKAKAKNKDKKKNTLFKDVEMQTDHVVILDNDMTEQFKEFLKQKNNSNRALSRNDGNESMPVSENNSGKKPKKEKNQKKNQSERNSHNAEVDGSNLSNMKQNLKEKSSNNAEEKSKSTGDAKKMNKREAEKLKRAERKAAENNKKADNGKSNAVEAPQIKKQSRDSNEGRKQGNFSKEQSSVKKSKESEGGEDSRNLGVVTISETEPVLQSGEEFISRISGEKQKLKGNCERTVRADSTEKNETKEVEEVIRHSYEIGILKLINPDSNAVKIGNKKPESNLKKKKNLESDRTIKESGTKNEGKSILKEIFPDANKSTSENEGGQRSPKGGIRSMFSNTLSSITNPMKLLKKTKKSKGDRSDSFPSEEEMSLEDAKKLQNLKLDDPSESILRESSKDDGSGKDGGCSEKLLELHMDGPDEARHDQEQASDTHVVGDHNMNHSMNLSDVQMSDSPASPTLPPVVSKYLTDDQAKPEPLIFPLIDNSTLPTSDKWAEGITEFKYDNVIEGGRGLHRSIHEVLKNYNNSSK